MTCIGSIHFPVLMVEIEAHFRAELNPFLLSLTNRVIFLGVDCYLSIPDCELQHNKPVLPSFYYKTTHL